MDHIRQGILQEELALTRHAVQEALAEQIRVVEIREAILNGKILEDYPDHRRGPCCLIYGKTNVGRDLHIVATKEKLPVRVITVYEPKLPWWMTPEERGQR
ncbi:MAG: DUF4258 domain-containing protein [Chloroflexi bacterium]|nr:DUF4258 domain-containing protein [Chloroflexota bacterium]